MIKLTFLGDIMCDYNMSKRLDRYVDEKGDYDFRSVFAHVKPLLNQSDYVFANLETPISADHRDLTNHKWTFNSPIEFAAAVKDAGVDFVSTANNHCLDRGVEGLQSTIQCLDSVGLDHCGINSGHNNRYRIVDASGVRIGVLAYTYGTNARSNHNYFSRKEKMRVNLLQEQEGRVEQVWNSIFHNRLKRLYRFFEKILFPENVGKQWYEKQTLSFYRRLEIHRDIRRIKREGIDLLVAYLHIGGQYNPEPSSYTRTVTKWFVRQGCDIVIDNHEHLIHGMEKIDRSIVAYALGDCLSGTGVLYNQDSFSSNCSIALHVYYDEDKKEIDRVSFSVLCVALDDMERYELWPIHEYYYTYRKNETVSAAQEAGTIFCGKTAELEKAETLI